MPETQPDPENVRVGAIIRTLRESRGLSSAELGRAIGVTEGHIRHIEVGRRRATLVNCIAIATALDAPLAPLVGEEVAALVGKLRPQPAQAAS